MPGHTPSHDVAALQTHCLPNTIDKAANGVSSLLMKTYLLTSIKPVTELTFCHLQYQENLKQPGSRAKR